MIEGNFLLGAVLLFSLFGFVQAWLAGAFWNERRKHGVSAAAYIAFFGSAITFTLVTGTAYEFLVVKMGWTHEILTQPAGWCRTTRHWVGYALLFVFQAPGLVAGIYGTLTVGKARHLQDTLANAGRQLRLVAGQGDVVNALVDGAIDTIASTPRVGRGNSFSVESGSSRDSRSSRSKSSSSSGGGDGDGAAGGLGALLLAVIRFLLKFLIILVVVAIGFGIAAIIRQISTSYYESKILEYRH